MLVFGAGIMESATGTPAGVCVQRDGLDQTATTILAKVRKRLLTECASMPHASLMCLLCIRMSYTVGCICINGFCNQSQGTCDCYEGWTGEYCERDTCKLNYLVCASVS